MRARSRELMSVLCGVFLRLVSQLQSQLVTSRRVERDTLLGSCVIFSNKIQYIVNRVNINIIFAHAHAQVRVCASAYVSKFVNVIVNVHVRRGK